MEEWFIVLFALVPIAFVAADRYRLWRMRVEWRREATNRGLSLSGAAPVLRLEGEVAGVEITIVQNAVFRYKQPPLLSFMARARLPSLDSAEMVASYRSEPVPPAPFPDRAPLDDPIVDGWVEHVGDGRLRGRDLGPLIERLVRTAHAAAVAARKELTEGDTDASPAQPEQS